MTEAEQERAVRAPLVIPPALYEYCISVGAFRRDNPQFVKGRLTVGDHLQEQD